MYKLARLRGNDLDGSEDHQYDGVEI